MKKYIIVTLIICLIFANLTIYDTTASVKSFGIPAPKEDGTKFSFGYCESENFIVYTESLVAIIKGLEEMGWITNLAGFNEVADTNDSRIIWEWLASNDVSPYIEFVEDAFYNLRQESQEEVVNRIKNHNDIDIMLTMGSHAGIILSEFQHDTNVFVFAASNAVRSGIIHSSKDSGKDNVWAHMDEGRFERQVKAFYDIVEFKKLGIVYEDSENARVYSAVNEIESLAQEKGFEIIRYHVQEPRNAEDYPRYYQEVKEAYFKLAQQVDAVYITIASLESEKLPELFKPFYDKKIPIFSQLGNIEVKNGALITVSVNDVVNIGRFGAYNIVQCLLGTKPRELQQTFQSAPQIALNVEVVKMLDFKLPFELVVVIDEAYQTIGE